MAALDRHTVSRFHAVLKAVPGHIAAFDQLRHLLLALQDHAELGLVAGHVDGPVQERLVMHHPARLDPARGGDDRLGRAVIDPHGQFGGGKAAEDDGMDGPQPGAGQHRLQRLGDHRHVDDHPVALGDALGAQRAGQRCDALLQFGIGDGALRMGDGAVMDDRRLVAAPGQHMPVDRVPAGVHHRIGKPLIQGRAICPKGAGRRRDPVNARGGLHPVPFRILLGLCLHICVCHGIPFPEQAFVTPAGARGASVLLARRRAFLSRFALTGADFIRNAPPAFRPAPTCSAGPVR